MKVNLYTKNNCPKCENIKLIFNSMGIDYVIINMDESVGIKEFISEKGFMTAPVLQIDDDFIGNIETMKKKALELL